MRAVGAREPPGARNRSPGYRFPRPRGTGRALRPAAQPTRGRAALPAAAPSPRRRHGTGREPGGARRRRSLTLTEFRDYLRTVNSRDGLPYQDATINAYIYPAKALDAWMTEKGLDGDFTTVDTGPAAECQVNLALPPVAGHRWLWRGWRCR